MLREVAYIAAEDTRHSRHLLRSFGIMTPLRSLHEHNERGRVAQVLRDLAAGKSIALISDAGTPLISDPGYHVLRRVHEAGLKAVPIPGPSSLLAALSVAGLPTDRFVFEGFLPAKSVARRRHLRTLAHEERTLVFFEASHRVAGMLADLAEIFGGERQAAVARELTKLFEEIRRESLAELYQWVIAEENHRRGEFVIIVHGAPPLVDEPANDEARHLLLVLLEELPLRRAVTAVVKLTGLKKNRVYDMALSLKDRPCK
jgi:16S rRNA (cytidine1402-2'-O)-methyltransferase